MRSFRSRSETPREVAMSKSEQKAPTAEQRIRELAAELRMVLAH